MSAFNECGAFGKPSCVDYMNQNGVVSVNMSTMLQDKINISPGYNYISLSRNYIPAGVIPTLKAFGLSLFGPDLFYELNEPSYSDRYCSLGQLLSCSPIRVAKKNIKMSVRVIMDYEKTIEISSQYTHIGLYNLTASVSSSKTGTIILVDERQMSIEPIVSGYLIRFFSYCNNVKVRGFLRLLFLTSREDKVE
jgi:hypothetical protein